MNLIKDRKEYLLIWNGKVITVKIILSTVQSFCFHKKKKTIMGVGLFEPFLLFYKMRNSYRLITYLFDRKECLWFYCHLNSPHLFYCVHSSFAAWKLISASFERRNSYSNRLSSDSIKLVFNYLTQGRQHHKM